jgi:hypothetical protein
LIDDAHAAVSDASIELIATIKNRLTRDRLSRGVTVVWTVINLVRETAPTNWTFFHLLARSEGSPPSWEIGRPKRVRELSSFDLRWPESRSLLSGNLINAARFSSALELKPAATIS